MRTIQPKLSIIFNNSLLRRILYMLTTSLARLRNGDVIDQRRRIPVRIQVVVGSREWSRGRPSLVQETREVSRIGGQSSFEFGNRDVSNVQLLPSLLFVRLE